MSLSIKWNWKCSSKGASYLKLGSSILFPLLIPIQSCPFLNLVFISLIIGSNLLLIVSVKSLFISKAESSSFIFFFINAFVSGNNLSIVLSAGIKSILIAMI